MIFAANILKGNKVKIPTFVVPGSTEVHADMMKLNLAAWIKGPNESRSRISSSMRDACSTQAARMPERTGRHVWSLEFRRGVHQHDQPEFPRSWEAKSRGLSRESIDGRCERLDRFVTDPREYVTKPIETGMAGVL
jgi:hypothetical protein